MERQINIVQIATRFLTHGAPEKSLLLVNSVVAKNFYTTKASLKLWVLVFAEAAPMPQKSLFGEKARFRVPLYPILFLHQSVAWEKTNDAPWLDFIPKRL